MMSPEEKRAYDRAYYAAYAPEKKARKVALMKARLQSVSAYMREYKARVGCACGEMDPICLDFHHHNDDKEINVADAARHGWSWARLETEIKKCVVICSNCHRKLHHAVRTTTRTTTR